MKGSGFSYLLQEGAKNVWLNRLMSFASIGVLVCCLILIGSAQLFALNIKSLVGYIQDKNEVVVFIKEAQTKEQLSAIDVKIRKLSNISKIAFLSKEQVLLEQKKQMGNSAILFEGLENEENPFPNTYRIVLEDISKMSSLVAQINKIDGVEQVNAPADVAGTLVKIEKLVSVFGVAIVLILSAVSSVIVANTIRMTVFARRKEINIMKYVGATDWFIRLPFILEAVFIALIAAFISFGTLWLIYREIVKIIVSNTSAMWLSSAYNSIIGFRTVAPQLFLAFVGSAVVICVFGALLSIRKHLKV